MGLFGNKPGNGHGDKSGRQPVPEFAEISRIIAERLSSEQNEKVLMGIGDIMRGEQMGRKYRPSEVVDKLAEVLQFPHSDEVMEKAGDALVEKLRNGVHFEDAQMILTNRLGRRTEANAKFFVKMLDRLEYKAELRRLAVEMLAGFRGVELRPGTIDTIEMALLQRLMHPNESEEVKKAIKERFGKEGKGRPHIYVEERRGDETVAIEAEPGPGKDSAAVIKARDIPTEGMDIVAGFLMQLKDGGLFEKERAAMALIKIVENSKDRKQIERVRDGVLPLKSEFPVLHRIVLKAMQNVLPDWNSSKPPIAIAPGNGRKPLESKDPTPMAPLKTR